MNNTTISAVAAKALPALSGASVTFNPEKNVYLTLGYTSNAGNTYFKAVRFSDDRCGRCSRITNRPHWLLVVL